MVYLVLDGSLDLSNIGRSRGYQPNWNIEVVGNTLPNSRGITMLTCDQKWNVCDETPGLANGSAAFNGALNSVVTIRRNWMGSGQGISLHGTTSDAVVESNMVHAGNGGFMKDPVQVDVAHTDHVLLLNNRHDA